MLFESEREEGDAAATSDHELWVDKYSPGHYTELLSDDVSKGRAIVMVRHTVGYSVRWGGGGWTWKPHPLFQATSCIVMTLFVHR